MTWTDLGTTYVLYCGIFVWCMTYVQLCEYRKTSSGGQNSRVERYKKNWPLGKFCQIGKGP